MALTVMVTDPTTMIMAMTRVVMNLNTRMTMDTRVVMNPNTRMTMDKSAAMNPNTATSLCPRQCLETMLASMSRTSQARTSREAMSTLTPRANMLALLRPSLVLNYSGDRYHQARQGHHLHP